MDSTSLASAYYKPEEEILTITFRHGGTYRYFHVPPRTYRSLLRAPSKGQFFTRRIRDRFQFEKVGENAGQPATTRRPAEPPSRALGEACTSHSSPLTTVDQRRAAVGSSPAAPATEPQQSATQQPNRTRLRHGREVHPHCRGRNAKYAAPPRRDGYRCKSE